LLNSFANVRDCQLSRIDLLKELSDAEGLIVRLGYQVDEELLTAAPKLRFIATATTGLNHIDLEAAAKRSIEVLSLKGESRFLNLVTATAELTWGLLLALVRKMPTAIADVRCGNWRRDPFKGRELSGMTLGIVGYGRLGRIVASYGTAFRMKVIASDPSPISRDDNISFMPLAELLALADVVSVHVALTKDTLGLINEAAFGMMKAGAYLINTARGELIEESALLGALESGRLAGAALDVLSNEKQTEQSERINHPLLLYAHKHENLLITPHIGGATLESMEKTEVFMAHRLRELMKKHCGLSR